MALEFARNRLFGREQDVAYLMDRCGRRGLTAVVGKPQMGKSWLLTEVARRLSEERPAVLVGYVESQGESADMLPRAVEDLYTRWLEGAGYREQAWVTFEQQKEGLIGRVGKVVGGLVSEVSKGVGLGVVGGLVKEGFEGLARVDEELKSGQMKLARLQLDDSRELLRILCEATGKRAVLVLDQWEKSPDLEKEAKILDSFLREVQREIWPECHIVLGTRDDAEPKEEVEKLLEGYPAWAKLRDLDVMHLEEAGATEALLAALRERIAATREVKDEVVLEMIAGYARVVLRWMDGENADAMRSVEDLKRVAGEAHAYQYPEFKKLLPGLAEEELFLTIRLALLPSASDAATWKRLKPIALGGCAEQVVGRLRREGVLRASSPPSFGHAKRAEAAQGMLMAKYAEDVRDEGDLLVRRLAGAVEDTSERSEAYAVSLATLRKLAPYSMLSPLARALCESASSMFVGTIVEMGTLIGIASQEESSIMPRLLAIGMINAFYQEKRKGELENSFALLDELRELARRNGLDTVVREALAKGLFTALHDAEEGGALDSRDKRLEELRELSRSYSGDVAVRAHLVKGLFNALNDAKERMSLDRCDSLLGELRELAQRHPSDFIVRQNLAMSLFNGLLDEVGEKSVEPGDQLLVELQQMIAKYPEDPFLQSEMLPRLRDLVSGEGV